MTRKSLILVITIVALTITGVLMITAQDADNTDTLPYGPGWMHNWDGETPGYGMIQGGFRHGMIQGEFGRGMMWSNGEPMMVTVADALGLEVEDLFTALHNGQTLTEIAEAQGVELDTVYDAMLTEAAEHMTLAVEAGTITQEQADEHLTWMRDNITNMPMLTGGQMGYGMMQSGFGHGMMQSDFGHGMMGRRGGMRWNG